MSQNALVTGANGFVGNAVARHLLGRGWRVRTLVRKGSDRRTLEGLAIETVEGDLRDPRARAEALRGVGALFHVAADYRLWVRDPGPMYETNVDATLALVTEAAAAGVGRIVHTSSVATIGLSPGRSPSDEDTPSSLEDMVGHYKRSKFIAEQGIRDLAARDGLPIVTVNPSTPIGPRDAKPTPTGRIVLMIARGQMPAYIATGLSVVHVDDVAAGHRLAFEHGRPGERYILGGENMPLRDLAVAIAEIAGARPPLFRVPAGLVMPFAHVAEWTARVVPSFEPMLTVDGVHLARRTMYFSSAKAVRELGYETRPARAALEGAVAWYRANGYL
jgi:dihydroflavonol-4-reductase